MAVLIFSNILLSAENDEAAVSLINLDPVTWIILGVLVLISIIMIAISFERWLLYARTVNGNRKFKVIFDTLRNTEMMKNLTVTEHSPFSNIFIGMNRRIFPIGTPDNPEPLSPLINELEMLSARLIREELHRLEGKISFLATTTTVSPFFGLLGTVWGIMLAFLAMGEHQSAVVSAVGPGIAAALITTMVGLIVAIPAVILYNSLSTKLKSIIVDIENFAEIIIEKAIQLGLVE